MSIVVFIWPARMPVWTWTGISAWAQRRQNVMSSPISAKGAPTGDSRNHGAANHASAATFSRASR